SPVVECTVIVRMLTGCPSASASCFSTVPRIQSSTRPEEISHHPAAAARAISPATAASARRMRDRVRALTGSRISREGETDSFQVGARRESEQGGVVGPGAAAVQDAGMPAGIRGRVPEDVEKRLLREVVRAGRRDEKPAGIEQLQGPEVDLLV